MAKRNTLNTIITAEDRASAKLRKVEDQTKRNVRQIKDVGGQSKASAELVGSLANQLGAEGLGPASAIVGEMSDRFSNFSEIMNAGGKGALIFKGTIVAATAALSVMAGKALGDVIFQTGKFNRIMEEAEERAAELRAELNRLNAERLDRELIGETTDELEKGIDVIKREQAAYEETAATLEEKAQKQIQFGSLINTILGATGQNLAENIGAQERLNEVTGKNAQIVAEAESAQKNVTSALQDRIAAEQKLGKLTREERDAQLKQGVDKVKAGLTEVKDAATSAAEQFAKSFIGASGRVGSTLTDLAEQARQKQTESLKNQITFDQAYLESLQSQLSEIEQAAVSAVTPELKATDIRGLTGNRATFRKSVAEREAEKHSKQNAEMIKLQNEQNKVLLRILDKETQLNVIGN